MNEQLELDFDSVAADLAGRAGMEKASQAERVQLWKQAAAAWFSSLIPGVEITADDLVREIGLPDSGPARNNVVGAIFSAASKADTIMFTGRFKKSERVIGHGNLQRIWMKVGDGRNGA